MSYPVQIDSVDDFYKVAKDANTYLVSDITADDLILNVTDASVFPCEKFVVTLNSELIIIHSKNELLNTLNVDLRGAFGSISSQHKAKDKVNLTFTAQYYKLLFDSILNLQKELFYYRRPVLAVENNPPEFPLFLDTYIVGLNPTGSWIAKENKICFWNGLSWDFIEPLVGFILYSEDSKLFLKYTVTGWQNLNEGDFLTDIKSLDYIANVNEFIRVNTTNNPVVITLPSEPSTGDSISIIDLYGTFFNNNCTISTGNILHKIQGTNSSLVLATNQTYLKLFWNEETLDWRIQETPNQKLISFPTENNIVTTDEKGQTKDSGLSISTDQSFLDNSDSKISTQKATKSYVENNTLGSVNASSGLVLNGREIGTLYASAIADDVQSVAVGGAQPAPASEWKTKTLVQSLDTILFPDVYPTYTIPSMSMTSSQSGNKEIGQTISQSLSSLVNKNDAGAVYQVLFKRGSTTISTDNSPPATSISDIAPQFGYNDPNNPNYRYSSSYTDNFVVVSGATSWTSSCSYSAGLAKKNNKGVDDDRAFAVRSTNAPQAASTTLAASVVTVTGLYPYFWGYSDTALSASEIATIIQSGASNKVLSSASGTIVISYNMPSDKFIWFAHVSSYTSKTKWYVTALNNGDIGPGQFIASPVLQNATSPDSFWSNVQFKIYISSYSSYLNSAIEFRNS